jgi:hypothetical protein
MIHQRPAMRFRWSTTPALKRERVSTRSARIPVHADEGSGREKRVDRRAFEIGRAEQEQRFLSDRVPRHGLGEGEATFR